MACPPRQKPTPLCHKPGAREPHQYINNAGVKMPTPKSTPPTVWETVWRSKCTRDQAIKGMLMVNGAALAPKRAKASSERIVAAVQWRLIFQCKVIRRKIAVYTTLTVASICRRRGAATSYKTSQVIIAVTTENCRGRIRCSRLGR